MNETDSTSSNLEDEEENQLERKRYKLNLHEHERHLVCKRTRNKYYQSVLPKSSSPTLNILQALNYDSRNKTQDAVDSSAEEESSSTAVSSKISDSIIDNDVIKSSVSLDDESRNNLHIPNPEELQGSIVHEDVSSGNGSVNNNILDDRDDFSETNSLDDCNNSDNEYNSSDDNIESHNESENESDDLDNEYRCNDVFDRIMFETSQISIRDIVLMCTAFSLRYKIPVEGKLVLADMFKLCAGPQYQNINFSKFMFSKCFPSRDEHITYHYFCSSCSEQVVYPIKATEKLKKNVKALCDKCEKNNSIQSTCSNYFLSIDLKYQIRQLFMNDLIIDDILKTLESRKNSNFDKISDVYDGKLHKKMMETNFDNDQNVVKHILTLNFNTDGAPLTNSGKRAFWPLQVILNDLSPKLRFRYVLLVGLLTVQKEPKSNVMNLYLSKFFEQIFSLYNEGISYKRNGKKILFKCLILNCSVDSVARPVIQNRIQFNGYYGCSWCYEEGTYIQSAHGIRYLIQQNETIRTDESHRLDTRAVLSLGRNIRGVKGSTSAQDLPFFDMVWSFTFEYMHGLLLNVVQKLWEIWKNGMDEYKISKQDIERIEKRFLTITPTHDMHRLPRPDILQGTAKPKASELKSWLLYYSLPCLNGILREDLLDHFAILVKYAHILLKKEISLAELDECEQNLRKFVCAYEMFYGLDKMTFSLHSLLHIVESIRNSGPLCMNSAFPFESNIHVLKDYINGPMRMDLQMGKKHLQSLIFRIGNTQTLTPNIRIKQFCQNLFVPKRLSTFYDNSSGVTYVGRSQRTTYIDEYDSSAYEKCIFNGVVYHSSAYSRAKKTDDTVVQLKTGETGRIIEIIKYNDSGYFKLSLFELYVSYPFVGVSHIKKVRSEGARNIITSIDNVECKLVLVNVRNARYLCYTPNTIEIQ